MPTAATALDRSGPEILHRDGFIEAVRSFDHDGFRSRLNAAYPKSPVSDESAIRSSSNTGLLAWKRRNGIRPIPINVYQKSTNSPQNLRLANKCVHKVNILPDLDRKLRKSLKNTRIPSTFRRNDRLDQEKCEQNVHFFDLRFLRAKESMSTFAAKRIRFRSCTLPLLRTGYPTTASSPPSSFVGG